MDMQTLGIPLVILMSFAIILWFLIGARGHWGLKLAVISIAFISAIGVWKSIDNAKGYETSDPLPNKFQVHWIVVDEPSKGDEGSIRVWVTEIQTLKKIKTRTGVIQIPSFVDKSQNRVYKLKYSKKRRDQAGQILQMIKNGRMFLGTNGKGIQGKGKGNKDGKGKGNGKGESKFKGKGGSNSISNSDSPMFYQLPPPIFPKKDKS